MYTTAIGDPSVHILHICTVHTHLTHPISSHAVYRHLAFIFPTTSAGRQKGGLASTLHDGASLNTGAKVSSKEPLSYEEDFVSERY